MKVNSQRGIVKTILIVLIGIIILSYFGINLQQVTQSDLLKKNLAFTWGIVTTTWTNYVYEPIIGIFHKGSSDSTNLSQ